MYLRKLLPLSLLVCVSSVPAALYAQTANPTVRFHTSLGDIDVTLRLDAAPFTVANFLSYLRAGSYNNGIFHRSVPGFVIQGGGYQIVNHAVVAITPNPPVRSEYKLSNTRGTLAMALFGSDINSGTDQWYFNLTDNSASLDPQSFTVFGTVVNNAGLAVMDQIAALPVVNNGSGTDFATLPVMNYKSGPVQESNYVLVTSIEEVTSVPNPAISDNGIALAGAYGGFAAGAPGAYLEIYGNNLSGSTRAWTTGDFSGPLANHAPTSLDLVSVTIGGHGAYVNYISPTQVNVQVSDNFPKAGTFPVVLTYRGFTTAPYSFTINTVQPGLLAPASFKVGDKQYVVAVHATGALVANNIKGVANAPAAPGETIVLYGTGWGGVVDTSAIAGEINLKPANLESAVQFTIGSIAVQAAYAGLAPGLVGVDQFNIVVPLNAPSGDLPFIALLNGAAIPQTLWLPVQQK